MAINFTYQNYINSIGTMMISLSHYWQLLNICSLNQMIAVKVFLQN